jgi:DNA polymerase I
VSKNFTQVVVTDFEYEVSDGNLPHVLCMVAYVLNETLQHVHTTHMWREELYALRKPPFDVGGDTLFVAYSAWAELTCFKVLGWRFPIYIFDQHTAYLAASNFLLPYDPDEKRAKPRKRLPDACQAYGIEGWENLDKKQMAEDIGNGLWRKYGQQAVFDYCEEDVRKSTKLLRRQLCGYGHLLPPANVEHVLHWSNYSAKSIALIQARGIPIDTFLWNLVQENKAAVIQALIQQFDPSCGNEEHIFSLEGEWSYARFARWLARVGVMAWPRLESGQLDISSDAFRLMQHIPGIEALHMLRDVIGFIARARLPIGTDGRNRPSLFPFGTASGRNAHAKSPFNAHAGVRSFIVFPPESIGVYLDWRTQEVGIAAAHADDPALKLAYQSGDVYHALARSSGFTANPDPIRWKADNPDTRQRMKQLQLGLNYGMGVPSLAKGLNRHPLIASGIIEQHKRTYPRFWQWRDEAVMDAMLTRRIESVLGWPLHLTTSPNKRTLYNFPMQSGGAEMLRLAAWRLTEAGIIPVMLIHDAVLLEAKDHEQTEHAKEIMRAVGRDVCDGFEIGVDVDQLLVGGARYTDKRPMAKQTWATMMRTLEAVGAMPRRAS